MMKKLNLIKIILLSTILLPYFIASAGFMDDMKEKKRLKNLREACETKKEKECFSLAKELSGNPSPEAQKESMERFTQCCKFGGISCCSELVRKGDFKNAWESLRSAFRLFEPGRGFVEPVDASEKRRLFLDDACFKVEVLEACNEMCYSYSNSDNHSESRLSECFMKAAEIAGKNNPSDKPNEEQKKWWVEACDRGKVLEACTNLGLYYNDHDEKKLSLIYLEKACAPANPRGCSALGFRVRENGDINKAETYYSMACAGNYEDSCETLEAIRKEIAEIKNKKEAQVEQNRKLCAEGVRLSCYQMGEYYYELGLFKYAIEDYIKACNGGYAPGCNGAGWVYRNNLNKPADAKKYYLLACNLKDPSACNSLGAMESKKGNKGEAAKYYAMACDAGNTAGCNNLAGVQIDFSNIAEARKHLNEACDAGSNAACQKLLTLTKKGL